MPNSLRIAVYHNLPSGGGKRALFEWTRRLSNHHLLDAYTLSTANHEFCDIRPLIRKQIEFQFLPSKHYSSPLGRLNQYQRWRDLNRIIKLNQNIASQINGHGYDIAFINTCSYTSIPSIIQFLDLPTVFYLHEPYGPGNVRSIYRPYLRTNKLRKTIDRIDPLLRLYRNKLNTLQANNTCNAKLILANSNFTRQQMQTSFKINPPVLYYGVDLDSFHPIPEMNKADYLISVGELTPRKGFDFLIESLGLIPLNKQPELHLACNRIDVDERKYIENLAENLGVTLRIFNNLNTENLCYLYNRAKLCLYSPVLEPFGLVPLESMACGTAVVGIREGGFQESIISGRTGLLTDRDPSSFAEAIMMLLDNDQIRDELGKQAQEYVMENWTWDKSTDKLEQFFTEISKKPTLN